MSRLADSFPLDLPWAIGIDPTNRCVFKCNFCPTGVLAADAGRENGMMPFSLYKKIIDDMANDGIHLRALKLWKDGEPLMNPELPKFIRYAKEKKVADQIRLTTNAFLLDRMGEELIDAGLDWMMISYMSPDEKDYVELTGIRGNPQNRVLKNIEQFKAWKEKAGVSKPWVVAKMCVFPNITEKHIADFRNQMRGIVDEIYLENRPMNWDGSHNEDFRLGKAKEHIEKPNKVCPFGWYQMNVNFNGKVSICPVDWSMSTIVGDCNQETIKQIWTGPKMGSFRRMFARQEQHKNPACNNCEYYHYHEDHIDDLVIGNEKYL